MATLDHHTLVRIGDDPRRWLWLGLCALGGVLACTAVLGSVLAPRWPDAWSWSALTTRWHARVQADVDVRSGPEQSEPATPATAPNVTLATPMAGEPGAPPSVRPKAYSSVDTQTIAEARAYGNVPAAQRSAPGSAPPALARENDEGARASAVSTRALPPPASTTGDAAPSSRPSLPRSPTVVAPPQGVVRARGELALLDPRVEAPRRSNPRSETPPGDGYRASAPRVYPSPVDPTQTPPGTSRASREATLITQGSGASVGWHTGEDVPPAGVSLRPPSARQDAAAVQLDELWERRERWLRERLQARHGQR